MANILKNILSFSGLIVGVPVALPHRLNVNGISMLPRTVEPDVGGFMIAANTVNVTVTRTASAASGNVNVLVEFWHTIEAVVPLVPPPGKLIGQVPWIQQPGAGGGADVDAVIFDDAVPADRVNIRSDRATNQSPIDNTKVGITNLGSEDSAGPGATEDYATIIGGLNNVASGFAAVAEGNTCTASGNDGAHAEGFNTVASGDHAHAEGGRTLAEGSDAHAEGGRTQALGDHAHAEGVKCIALRSGQHTHSSYNNPDDIGFTQHSVITMYGLIPGDFSTTNVELLTGADEFFELEDDRAYNIVVTLVAWEAGSPKMRSFKRMYAVYRQGGTSTLEASGVAENIGSAGAAGWTFVASIGAAPDRFKFVVTTGPTTEDVRITAKVEFVEIFSLPVP